MLPVAIIGAGPYGLSVAANFRHRGIPYRIFGRPMENWLAHMPQGMMLKSDGFASNLDDPDSAFTLKNFCAERGIEYSDIGIPVAIETFTAYGLAFQQRFVPDIEHNLVVSLTGTPDGFLLRLDNGDTLEARRVVMASGITHFEYLPPVFSNLSPDLLSHSCRHHNLEPFRGRRVVVVGAGASGIDLAYLLHDSGAQVELVARQKELKFHDRHPVGETRPWWERLRAPQSGLGPGLKTRFYADAPVAFHYLPERLRIRIGQTSFKPCAGWFAKEKVIGRVPLALGYTPLGAEAEGGKVRLHLGSRDGSRREILADHVIAATGYKVNLERLPFLSADIRSKVKTVNGAPMLSGGFESSLSGLYFVGIAAQNTFGPVMRFAFGARFAARHLTRSMAKSLSRGRATSSVPRLSTSQNESTRAF